MIVPASRCPARPETAHSRWRSARSWCRHGRPGPTGRPGTACNQAGRRCRGGTRRPRRTSLQGQGRQTTGASAAKPNRLQHGIATHGAGQPCQHVDPCTRPNACALLHPSSSQHASLSSSVAHLAGRAAPTPRHKSRRWGAPASTVSAAPAARGGQGSSLEGRQMGMQVGMQPASPGALRRMLGASRFKPGQSVDGKPRTTPPNHPPSQPKNRQHTSLRHESVSFKYVGPSGPKNGFSYSAAAGAGCAGQKGTRLRGA